jgi:hypothetical protein
MARLIALISVMGALLGVPTASGAVGPATPPCPDVEGWSFTGSPPPINKPISVEFWCNYMRAGRPETLTLDVDWVKPSARDVDVDYRDCKRPSADGDYYRNVWSGKAFVRLAYSVTGGTVESNRAVFAAERARIERSAFAFLAATETLAKSCTKQTPPTARDTRRPTVQVEPASGKVGDAVVFGLKVADNSGTIGVVLTIYEGRTKNQVAFRKNYGKAKPGRYTIKIRVNNRGAHLWCITATDRAGNKATACSKLVVI